MSTAAFSTRYGGWLNHPPTTTEQRYSMLTHNSNRSSRKVHYTKAYFFCQVYFPCLL